jgi:phage terminase large subunit GpA-like protein
MRAMVDSGYDTDAVYDFCAIHRQICLPAKGANRKLTAPIHISTIERMKNGKQWFDGLKLYEVDTTYFKDFIFGRLEKDPETIGSWTLFKDCPREFADQICSEKKVETQDKKSKKITLQYLPVSSHAVNHLLDCSVYSAAAAENIGVRYLKRNQRNKQNRQYGVINKGLEY